MYKMWKFIFIIILSTAIGLHMDRDEETMEASSCSGEKKVSVIHPGEELEISTPGFQSSFIPHCQENIEIVLEKDPSELAQFRIRIEIVEMYLPCNISSVRISCESGKTLYCDNQAGSQSNEVFLSQSPSVSVQFRNQGSCKGDCSGIGARLIITTEYVCGGKYTEARGSISSPFYPLSYPESVACLYEISAPRGSRISLDCPYFNLSPSCRGRCRQGTGDRDFLQNIMSSERYEAHSLAGVTLVSKLNHHMFYFLSNSYSISEEEGPYGFNCSYHILEI